MFIKLDPVFLKQTTELAVSAKKADGWVKTFNARVRSNTLVEWDYYAHDGVLQYRLRQMAAQYAHFE